MDNTKEFYNETFRLVGVTFDNPDGTNRQKLLENIRFFHGSNGLDYKEGNLKVELVKYLFEGEDAIRLEVGRNGDVLGNVSRKDLPFILENYEYIHDIPYLDISGGAPRGCTFTVTFKNPNYESPQEIVDEPTEEIIKEKKPGFFSRLFKRK